MSFIQVGTCPKCGAPIYSPSMWHGITPPPANYTCSCYSKNNGISTSSDTAFINPKQ